MWDFSVANVLILLTIIGLSILIPKYLCEIIMDKRGYEYALFMVAEAIEDLCGDESGIDKDVEREAIHLNMKIRVAFSALVYVGVLLLLYLIQWLCSIGKIAISATFYCAAIGVVFSLILTIITEMRDKAELVHYEGANEDSVCFSRLFVRDSTHKKEIVVMNTGPEDRDPIFDEAPSGAVMFLFTQQNGACSVVWLWDSSSSE